MLYNEFLEGTGGHDNAHNYKLYKRLEIIYMTDDSISKSEIYDMGRKLIDNTPSKETQELIARLKGEIAERKDWIRSLKASIDFQLSMMEDETPDMIKERKRTIRNLKEQIKQERIQIKGLEFILAN